MFTESVSLQAFINGFLLMRPDFSAWVLSLAKCMTKTSPGHIVAGLQQIAETPPISRTVG